jgi:GMP synthase-like glutamine amidotransferase
MGGDCNGCHNAGDGSFWASYGSVAGQNMSMVMFQETQTNPYIFKWVTGTVDTNGNFKDLAPSNAIANQAIASQQCAPGTVCHPKFQLNPAVVAAIDDFVNLTLSKWHNNLCGASGIDAGGGDGGHD